MMFKHILNSIIDKFANTVVAIYTLSKKRVIKYTASRFPGIDPSVMLGIDVILRAPPDGIVIGKGTYINEAIISANENSPVVIGEYCAIGYRVSIKAVTHDPADPAPDLDGRVKTLSAPIIIGDRCWIGDNVYVKEGVVLGNGVIVGANSVVTKSFGDDAVIGGVPAKLIR